MVAASPGARQAPAPPLEVVPARSVVVAEAPRQRITANEYVAALIRAGGDPLRARELIQAAVPPVTHTADVPGALPPNYTTEILGGLPPNQRPLAGICTQRPIPASGMKLSKPVWGTLPNGGWMADDTAAPAYGVASITLREVPIEQWAWATGYSIAVQERTAPDYVDSVYQQAVESYYVDVEARIGALIESSAIAAATIGGGVAAVGTTSHRAANVLVLSPDVLGELIDAEGVIKYSSASVDASGGVGQRPGDRAGAVAGRRQHLRGRARRHRAARVDAAAPHRDRRQRHERRARRDQLRHLRPRADRHLRQVRRDRRRHRGRLELAAGRRARLEAWQTG